MDGHENTNPLSSDPRRRRGRFLRSLLLSLALLFVLRRSLTCSRSGIPAPPRARGRDLRAHGRGGEDPGGIPSLVRRRGEELYILGAGRKVSRRANRARRFTDSAEALSGIHVEGWSENTLEKRLLRKSAVGEGRYSSVILVTSDYHVPRAVLAFRKVLPKDVALSAIRVRPEGGAGATWRWARQHFIEGGNIGDTAFSCAGSSAGSAPTGRRLLSCARRTRRPDTPPSHPVSQVISGFYRTGRGVYNGNRYIRCRGAVARGGVRQVPIPLDRGGEKNVLDRRTEAT